MKKLFALTFTILMLLSLSACGIIGGEGSDKASGHKIPDVFGIDYNDAIPILEADGFEVSAIATNVGDISEKLLYPLEKVSKGVVFKIDDYILDNTGNLTKNYDIIYGDERELLSDDKTLVIYYAKEDFVLVEETPSTNATEAEENTPTESSSEDTSAESTIAPESESRQDEGIRSDFKDAMDSYEAFMDEYVAFMKKYYANPSDTTLLMEYADYLNKYAEFVADFDAWDSEELNSEELAYYIEVQSRVSTKLLEIYS